MTSSSLVAVVTEPPDLSSASFQHGGKACFGSRPPSGFAHRTTVPSHWAWESGLCKSRQSGLKDSPAQKRPGANTVGESKLRSGDECPLLFSLFSRFSDSKRHGEKRRADLSGRKCFSVFLACLFCSLDSSSAMFFNRLLSLDLSP